MTDKPYRFRCLIETPDGDVLIEDYCSLTSIDQFGGCESVDMHVGSMLRMFNRTVRAQHENDEQLVTQTAERIRAVVGG